jgi:hypothetical protein
MKGMTIQSLKAKPYPDRRRVGLEVKISEIVDPPDLEIEVFNASDELVASSSVIATTFSELDLTMHLREPEPEGQYTLRVTLSHAEKEPVDEAEARFVIEPTEREG